MSELSPNLFDLDRFSQKVERVEKPWGYEIIFAATPQYCGKILFIRKGEQLSLQFHREKDEVVYLHEGRIELEIGDPGGTLDVEVVSPGHAFASSPESSTAGARSRTRPSSRCRRRSSTTSSASRIATAAPSHA